MTRTMLCAFALIGLRALAGDALLWERTWPPEAPAELKSYYLNCGTVPLVAFGLPGHLKIHLEVAGTARANVRIRITPQLGEPFAVTALRGCQATPDGVAFDGIAPIEIDPDLHKRVDIYAYNIDHEEGKTLLLKAVQASKAPPARLDEQGDVRPTFSEFDYDPGFFPLGCYLYFYDRARLAEYAEAYGTTADGYLETAFADMAAHGCNCVFTANIVDDPELFRNVIARAKAHGLKLFSQGTRLLYVRPERGREYYDKTTVPAICETLPQYADLTGVAGYTSKEEAKPVDEDIQMLQDSRALVRRLLPAWPSYTLHNNVNAMRMDDGPVLPDWYGFDRYRFRVVLDAKSNYVISTPSDVVRLLVREIGEMYDLAAARRRPLIYVGQGYKARFRTKNAAYSAATGFREMPDGTRVGWFRYLPQNGISLQFYLALSQGCRGFLLYHYQTLPLKEAEVPERRYEQCLVSPNGEASRFWDEAGECFREAQPYLPLFRKWCREGVSAAAAKEPDFIVSTFILPNCPGRFVLAVNTRIATWDKTNPIRTTAETELHYTPEELAGFQWAASRSARLFLKETGELRDVLTGEVVASAEITIPPGKARVLFQGSADEWAKCRQALSLQKP